MTQSTSETLRKSHQLRFLQKPRRGCNQFLQVHFLQVQWWLKRLQSSTFFPLENFGERLFGIYILQATSMPWTGIMDWNINGQCEDHRYGITVADYKIRKKAEKPPCYVELVLLNPNGNGNKASHIQSLYVTHKTCFFIRYTVKAAGYYISWNAFYVKFKLLVKRRHHLI